MSRVGEALRRLGAPFCSVCNTVADAVGPRPVVVAVLNEVRRQHGRGPVDFASTETSTRWPLQAVVATMCGDCAEECRVEALRQREEDVKRQREQHEQQMRQWRRDLRDRMQVQRDMYRATLPSSKPYRDAVKQYRDDIVAAARSWRIGGGIFGGNHD